MLNTELIQILNSLLGQSYKYTAENYLYYCPSCHYHTQKLSICVQTNSKDYGKYHCWVCGFKGKNLYNLLRFLKIEKSSNIFNKFQKVYKVKDISYSFKSSKITSLMLPDTYQILFSNKPIDIFKKRVLNYLSGRNITVEDIIRYNIGFCRDGKYKERIIIPSYDQNFNLNYFISRSIILDDPIRYLNPTWSKNIIFNEHLIDFNFPIILCQGVFDAISFKRNAIPLLGKTLPQKLIQKLVKYKPNVYVCLDSDATNESYKICKQLSNIDIKTFIVKIKQKDPGSLTLKQLQQYIKNANEYSKYSNEDYMKFKLQQFIK